MRIKMNRKVKRILSIVLGLALLFGAVALVVNLVKPKDNELKEIHPTFEVGGLDENGEYVDTKESIYTKKVIEYNELKVSIDFDANIQYQLFYYDEDDKFVSASEVFTKGHNEESEETKYVRVLITPVYADDVEDEEKEIKWHEVFGYANQLTISTKVNAPVEGVLTITLNYDGDEFVIQYEKGMTWEEWLASEYNTLNATFGDHAGQNSILFETGIDESYRNIYLTTPNGNMEITDKIDNNLDYKLGEVL